MKNQLTVLLEMPAEEARICCESVGIEAKSEALSRSSVELIQQGDALKLVVSSQDLGAMRAALNTYLRWIIMCHGLVDKKRK